MKRILVVDKSQPVRETIALVLGRDFTVFHRSPRADCQLLTPEEEKIDLLIFGAPPGLGSRSPALQGIAFQAPCPVLFLVDSRLPAEGEGTAGKYDWLAKPFNPYQLKEKVARLLSQARLPSEISSRPFLGKGQVSRYLDFPYLPASTSALAKRFALTSLPILILGETGSGQEKIARALHSLNNQAGPWVAAYLTEISQEWLERKIRGLVPGGREKLQRVTLFLFGLETLEQAAQASLLRFLEEEEEAGQQIWVLSSSRADLLEKVYRGEFLDVLYYRLARLTLRLSPLRDRPSDLPSLAARVAEEYGARLGVGKVSLSAAATVRLSHYLWFGNLEEMETVIARALSARRKGLIEAGDLVLGDEGEIEPSVVPFSEGEAPSETEEADETKHLSEPATGEPTGLSRLANGDYRDIRVLINELAHELKNPMVTIKTFTQLLDDRYDDEAFRGRFQETVGNDIARMDELVETLLDFSRFTEPACEKVVLYEHLRRVLEEILPECIRREATIRWGSKEESSEVFADKAQLHYAFTNVLRSVLAQLNPRGEIQIDVAGEGKVSIAYVREGGQMSSLTHYLDLSSSAVEEEGLPLRILLAKILLQRIGGGLAVNRLEGGKVLIRAELPIG